MLSEIVRACEGRYPRCKFVALDELVVLVRCSGRLILHFLREILEEAAPARRRAELGNVIRGHLDTLVRAHEKTASRQMVDIVNIRSRRN